MADDDCDVVVSAGVFCLFYMDEDEQDTNLEQRRRRVRRPRRFWVHDVIQRREISYKLSAIHIQCKRLVHNDCRPTLSHRLRWHAT